MSLAPWLAALSANHLRALAARLRDGSLLLPCAPVGVVAHVPHGEAEAVVEALNSAHATTALSPQQLAWMLDLLARDRAAAFQLDEIDLVWSGPEVVAEHSRETGTVVRELFGKANKRVLVASYVIDTGQAGKEIFQPLAERMAALPSLTARCFFSIVRRDNESKDSARKRFCDDFRHRVWPGGVRLPALYYDPRSLEEGAKRSCLHAKCVVVDGEVALVTSANFTAAALHRNIEAGTLVRRPSFALVLERQFNHLAQRGDLKSLL